MRSPAALILGLGILLPAGALAADYPRLMWAVSDDDLATPIGAIGDVAVDANRTVYLLDTQTYEVRRIAVDGTELPPLGRKGEGPGEFEHPSVIAAVPAGGVVVVQLFHSPASCLMPNGNVCATADMNVIRQRFGMTDFMAPAMVDQDGTLILAAVTNEKPYDRLRPDQDLGTARSVFAIKRGDAGATVLFTSSRTLGDAHTVRYAENMGYFVLRCWDVDAAGRFIYADPDGKYSVWVGHPTDGRSVRLPLTPAPGDEAALAKRAKAEGRPVERIARIVDVHWIDEGRFLVQPTAALPGKKLWRGGVVEIFDTGGRSLGRQTIAGDYDHEQDAVFLRGAVLVVIRGGQSAMRASLRMKPAGSPADVDETIVVEAYDLAPR